MLVAGAGGMGLLWAAASRALQYRQVQPQQNHGPCTAAASDWRCWTQTPRPSSTALPGCCSPLLISTLSSLLLCQQGGLIAVGLINSATFSPSFFTRSLSPSAAALHEELRARTSPGPYRTCLLGAGFEALLPLSLLAEPPLQCWGCAGLFMRAGRRELGPLACVSEPPASAGSFSTSCWPLVPEARMPWGFPKAIPGVSHISQGAGSVGRG